MTATVAELPVEHLGAVGLEELVDEAALLTRVDRKYVVPARDVPGLVGELPAGTRVLEIGPLRSFRYSSTYLDTPELASFHAAGRGRRRRWKVRTRTYVDTDATFLEVKTQGGRGTTVKERIPHVDPAGRRSGPVLTPEGAAYVGDQLGPELTARLRPTLVTTYDRTTFLAASGARATVDLRLGFWSLLHGGRREFPEIAVVETKSGSRPSEVDRLLWRRGHRPASISKYGVGLAALHPELPRLKWHRVLQRHLGVPRRRLAT